MNFRPIHSDASLPFNFNKQKPDVSSTDDDEREMSDDDSDEEGDARSSMSPLYTPPRTSYSIDNKDSDLDYDTDDDMETKEIQRAHARFHIPKLEIPYQRNSPILTPIRSSSPFDVCRSPIHSEVMSNCRLAVPHSMKRSAVRLIAQSLLAKCNNNSNSSDHADDGDCAHLTSICSKCLQHQTFPKNLACHLFGETKLESCLAAHVVFRAATPRQMADINDSPRKPIQEEYYDTSELIAVVLDILKTQDYDVDGNVSFSSTLRTIFQWKQFKTLLVDPRIKPFVVHKAWNYRSRKCQILFKHPDIHNSCHSSHITHSNRQ